MTIPCRKNPERPWKWQYRLPDGKWISDLPTAEHIWQISQQAAEVDA